MYKDNLIIKFWRIENIVLMKILHQPINIERGGGLLCMHKGMAISSVEGPDLTPYHIYINGSNRDIDNKVVYFEFSSSEKAEENLQKYIDCINTYNSSRENRNKTNKIVNERTIIIGG